jgi:hypothetical protein
LTDRPRFTYLFPELQAQESTLPDDLKDSILSIFEASLDAQLRAVRRLRRGPPEPAQTRRRQGLSQVDMAYDILRKARTPLHISELLARIHSTFHLTVDRASLVSSLSKKNRPWRSLHPHPQEHLRFAPGGPMTKTLLVAWLDIVSDWCSSFPQPNFNTRRSEVVYLQ